MILCLSTSHCASPLCLLTCGYWEAVWDKEKPLYSFSTDVHPLSGCLSICLSLSHCFCLNFLSLYLSFLFLWSCLCFMSCPWRLALSSPVGSTDALSFCLLIKSHFWKGEEERRNRLKQMQQCSGDCEFCAVDEYNLQTADHAIVVLLSHSGTEIRKFHLFHLSWDQQ